MISARRAALATLAVLALLVGPIAPAQASTPPVISGTVTGPDGEPIATNVFGIRLWDQGGSASVIGVSLDETGYFETTLNVTGSYRVEFRQTAGLNLLTQFSDGAYYYDDATPVLIESGGRYHYDIQMKAGGVIAGTLKGATGPLEDGRVDIVQGEVSSRSTHPIRVVPFNEDTQQFFLDEVPPGDYVLKFSSLSPTGLVPLYSGGAATLEAATPIRIEHGTVADGIDVVLPEVPSIEGEVSIDGSTDPEANTTVTLFASAVGGGAVSRSTPITGAGPFALENLAPGGEYRLCLGESSTRSGDNGGLYFDRTCVGQSTSHPNGAVITVPPEGLRDIDITVTARSGILLTNLLVRRSNGAVQSLTSARAIYWKLDAEAGGWVDVGQDSFSGVGSTTLGSPPLVAGQYRIELRYMLDGVEHREYAGGGTRFAEAESYAVGDHDDLRIELDPVSEGKSYNRIAGADRFAGAVELSKSEFASGSGPVVFVANGLNYPDALAAGPAAAIEGGPLLLVTPTSIPSVVEAELRRLAPSRIVIVGGTVSVSSRVESRLQRFVGAASDVTRLAGPDRYATSRAVVSSSFGDTTGAVVFVATGANYPDALAAGAAAGYFGGAVVLVDGSQSRLDAATRALLDDLQPGAIVIAGGPGVVSTALERAMRSRYGDTENPVVRLYGNDRYETAYAINQLFSDVESVYLASGEGFADALAGGPIAALNGSPLYLTRPGCVPWYVDSDIDALLAREVIIIGGTAVVQERVQRGAVC